MRWGRRRGTITPKKLHYTTAIDSNANPIASCKKEYDGTYRLTTEVHRVNCKSCIKKMLKDGVLNLETLPTYLHPTTPTPRASKGDVVSEEDFKNDYLKRIGVF